MKMNIGQINSHGVADKNRVEELKKFLIKLNADEITEEVRKEGLQIIESINPLELSLAEQALIEDGMDPSKLRNLCALHMEVLGEGLENLKNNIEKGHMLDTLILEHDEIEKLLDKLEGLNVQIQNSQTANEEIFKELEEVSQLILDAELHHKREEDVLFVELEKLGVTGPTRVMKEEHVSLREKKEHINKISKNYPKIKFEMVKVKLNNLIPALCFELRDHIVKENHILYPTAYDTIISKEKWDEMIERCDEIGYCPFTPNK
ncbi:MAG: DUF438 domain-containing protein [Sarcina sp.]